MEDDKKPGADARVFSNEPVNDWYSKDENMDGPGGKDGDLDHSEKKSEKGPEKGSDDDLKEDDPKKKDPEKDLEKEGDSKEGGEDVDKGKKEEDRETFKKSFEKEKAKPIPERRERHPKMKEGDFTVGDDGEVTVHAKHIVDDYHAIVKDVKTYFKIFNSKGNQDKAEFIAEKLLGFEGDGVRSAGRVAYDVLDAFNKAESDEAATKIIEDFFPALLKDSEAESNVSFVPKDEKPDGKPSKESEDGDITEKDAVTALKIWSADSGVKIDAEKALDDPDLLDAYNGVKFDAETGEELSVEERMSLAAEIAFGEGREAEDTKEILSGGAKKGEKSSKGKADKKKKASVFTSSKSSNPKTWY